MSQQTSSAGGSDALAGTPERPRPKVLIPPVASPLPADSRSGEPVKSGSEATSRSFAPKLRRSPSAGQAPEAPATSLTGTPAADIVPGGKPVAVKTFRAPAARPGIARVHLTHVDPWSVMKQAFLLSLAIAIIILAASASLWFALDSAGVFDALTRTATDVGGEGGATVGNFLSFSKVMGVSLVLAGIETILVTALVTLFAFLYNLAVGIGGGLEVTLSEEG